MFKDQPEETFSKFYHITNSLIRISRKIYLIILPKDKLLAPCRSLRLARITRVAVLTLQATYYVYSYNFMIPGH